MIRRIGDQSLNLVLVFAPKRTSGDFNHLAALVRHDFQYGGGVVEVKIGESSTWRCLQG
jgi:hypothetical protein